ncbi:uncharacterized protein LOC141534349 [Cotesia typhae]|uniref:uncharacterized protein LOC141534349 n=1 Tax=Cotesia typhae TaxID=2053667 RepID=UPI003D68F92B
MSESISSLDVMPTNEFPLPQLSLNSYNSRPINRVAIVTPTSLSRNNNYNDDITSFTRSPTPSLVSSVSLSSKSYSRSSLCRDSTFSSNNFLRSATPRRFFPQDNSLANFSLKHDLSKKEQAPVVFDASLNFVLGIDKQKVRQSFRPTASHLEPETASSLLTSRIAQFLQRTDHIMQEWKRCGRNTNDNELDYLSMPYDKNRPLGKSKSAANIMIKGFQYFNRANSAARSLSNYNNLRSRLSEDRTLSECDDEVAIA